MITKNIKYLFSIFASSTLLLALGACSKDSMPPVPPVIEEPNIDYKKFDFGNMAAISGHSIEDTIWDAEKKNILGFRLGKSQKHPFLYPEGNGDQYPIASSTLSANSDEKVFSSSLYIPASKRIITRFALNAGDGSFVKNDFLLTDYNAQKDHIESFLKANKAMPYYGHKDFIYSFHNYENIKLIFGKDVDIQKLFNITNKSYPKIEQDGLLYYALNPTLRLRSTYLDDDYTNYFPLQKILDDNISRVQFIDYGKLAMMIIDADETKIKPLINKLTGGNDLTEAEKAVLNKAAIHFHYYGYTEQELGNKSDLDNLQRVKNYIDIAINVKDKTFNVESYGRPIQFELTTHSKNLEQFNNKLYFNQLTFKK
ncbi:hypothetical protein [Sphingobacterium sp. UBA1498]|uniref:hypothetical protein n=1 Tax=Sphingobacterium sp. UBA1498 TaxID=1947481 RepID=UPI0025EF4F54|nr:hypothetical protein [Sphingobacterium sp. UBA1498]